MIPLYSPDEAAGLSRRARLYRTVALILAAAALCVCVLLCFGVRPNNTPRRLFEVIAVSTAAGWAVILLMNVGYRPLIGTARHIQHISSAEATEYAGTFRKTGKLFQIPGSIVVQKIRLQQGDKALILNVDARKAHLLPDDGTKLRVQCRGTFITAFEVYHE